MSILLDEKYILLYSSNLKLFKKIGNNYNCRCPICGDSKKDKLKARGYFLRGDNGFSFYCQNCGASLSFRHFLENQESDLFKEYRFEAFRERSDFTWEATPPQPKKTKITQCFVSKEINKLHTLLPISALPDGHPAKNYIKNRLIPSKFYDKLFYTDNYKKWINENIIPNKFNSIPTSDKRIVIPFYSKDGIPYAYTGRALASGDNILRYLTIQPNDKNTLIYGLDRVDFSKDVYVTEGQFDSLFIDNCLAVGGSALNKLVDVEDINFIFIFDNQNRSAEIVALLEKMIDMGKKVVIFPNYIVQKDINEMILSGLSQDSIMRIIQENTWSGIKAKLKFNEWKRI